MLGWFWFSYFSGLVILLLSHIGYYLNVFVWLWKIGLNLGLFYPHTTRNAIDVSVNAVFAGCIDTRRSTTSYIVLFNYCCITWLSRKQSLVAKSTTEADFVAMSCSTHHIRWLLNGLTNLCLPAPIAMHADNSDANYLTATPEINIRTKHIAVDYFITPKGLQDNLLIIHKVQSTKHLAQNLHQNLSKTSTRTDGIPIGL